MRAPTTSLNATSVFKPLPGGPAPTAGTGTPSPGAALATAPPTSTGRASANTLPPGCTRSRRKTAPGPVAKGAMGERLGVPPAAHANGTFPVSDFLAMWWSHPAAVRIKDMVHKAFAPPVDCGDAPGRSKPEEGRCELPSRGLPQREVGQLIEYARGQGFEVKLSPGLRQSLDEDPHRSLKGVIVIVGDTRHTDEKLQRTIEAMVSRHFQHGGWFTPGDDMLAEVNWRLCLGREWRSWWNPFNSPCLRADDEALVKLTDAAFIAARDAALAFMKAIGVPVHDVSTCNAVLEAAAPYVDPVLGNTRSPPDQMAAARVLDQAWKQLDQVIAETREGREITQREMVLERAGDDHATFFVPGDKHAQRHFQDLAPLKDVIYLRKAA